MENATDALVMAGSVLLLIIALTVSISSFPKLKLQIDEIVQARDEVQLAKDSNTGEYINYLSSNNSNEIRTVKTEAILTELRRMRKEKNIIYIYGINVSSTPILNSLTVNLDYEQILKNGETSTKLPKLTQVVRFSLTDDKTIFYNGTEQGLNNDLVRQLYKVTNQYTFKEYIGFYQEKSLASDANMENARHKIITFVKDD